MYRKVFPGSFNFLQELWAMVAYEIEWEAQELRKKIEGTEGLEWESKLAEVNKNLRDQKMLETLDI